MGWLFYILSFCLIFNKSLGWENDCDDPDLSQCRSDIILCRNIFGKSKIYVEDSNEIKQFFISASYINKLQFLDVFTDLEL